MPSDNHYDVTIIGGGTLAQGHLSRIPTARLQKGLILPRTTCGRGLAPTLSRGDLRGWRSPALIEQGHCPTGEAKL